MQAMNKGIGPNALGSPVKLRKNRVERLMARAEKLAARARKSKTDEKFERLQNRSENLYHKARIIQRTKK